MAPTNLIFERLSRNHSLRSILFTYLDTKSLCALRLTSSESSELVTPILFSRTRLIFTASALTRPSRIEALFRIGPLIEHLTFSMPHSESTFLPPLLDPSTGREVNFLYTPHKFAASATQRPKYGSPELGELLTQQYPPIFHAATNVPAFINALSLLPNLRHLTISCPAQEPAQRYRRGVVDYALISLRIAIERAPLLRLEKLSLSHIHPAGIQYLRHTSGYGCTPSAGRRWNQIKKLNITMDSWDFFGPQPGCDHLKILDDYLRSFSNNLEKVSFCWSGRKGPCPFTLFTDPLFAPSRKGQKLFGEVTSPMSPLPSAPARSAIALPKLRYMQIRNATMSTEQVANFLLTHRHTVKEFDFANVSLINGGCWEDALAPLRRVSGSDEWLSQHSGSEADSTSSFDTSPYLEQIYEELDEVVESMYPITSEAMFMRPVEFTTTSVLVKRKPRHRKRRRKHRSKRTEEPHHSSKLVIADPITINRPIDELLMPTIFDPNIQGVQRNIRLEAAQQELADDPEKRESTLRKAKEMVLKKLGREFCRDFDKKRHDRSILISGYSGAGRKGCAFMGNHESRTTMVPLVFSR